MTFVIGTIKRCQKHKPIIFSYSPVELCGIKCVSLPVSPFPSFKPRDVCTASRTTSVNKLQRIFQIKFGCLLLRMRALRIQIVRSHWCTVYLQGRGSITLLHWELRLCSGVLQLQTSDEGPSAHSVWANSPAPDRADRQHETCAVSTRGQRALENDR